MPPKKRQIVSASSNARVQNEGTAPHQNLSQGLLAMPVELLDLISTHFGLRVEVPVGHLSNHTDPALPLEYHDRTDALRALSQTCHVLRLAFLPMLWECMNVCVKARTGKDAAFYKALGDLLKRTSVGLVGEPELLSYVRTVNVTLTRYASAEALPPFAHCLTQMPNMHTLQIVHAHTAMTTHLKTGFADTRLPNVRTIILPAWAHEVLRCCPEVTHVICNSNDSGKLVSAIAKSCNKVEILEGFNLCDDKIMKRVVKAVPNLTEVNFNYMPANETIASLSVFRNLRAIRLPHPTTQEALESGAYVTELSDTLKQSIAAAKTLLHKQPTANKVLRIRHTVQWPYPLTGYPRPVLRGRLEKSAVVEEIPIA
ncbi:hypothetical protein C8R44DRAFT_879197 [Mycena epipterygia]|nr:hypothetical protein C8R44DRAFT_879197 [Mycena epipterygia]